MSASFWVVRNGLMLMGESDTGMTTWPLAPGAFQYPGGEWSLRNIPAIENRNKNTKVTWVAMVRGTDPNDLVQAALLADVARRQGAEWGDKFTLLMPYLPAARADRGVPMGAAVYADIINSMGPNHVYTMDAHSAVMPARIDNCIDLSPIELIRRAITESGIIAKDKYVGVIAPDKGAMGRAEALANAWDLDEILYVNKVRDFDTGRIDSLEFSSSPQHLGRYLVVDDICDGGGTFRMLADAFAGQYRHMDRSKARDRLDLWVTHGIFSGAAHELSNYYTRIMTTDSHPGHSRVGVATTIVPVWPTMFNEARKDSND